MKEELCMLDMKDQLKDIKTCYLVEELKKRTDVVTAIDLGPHEDYRMDIEGPAVILTIID